MDGERENYASRRALLTGAPALAVVAAVAAETGIALANTSDPWVSLGAAYFRHWNACNAAKFDHIGDAEYAAYAATCARLTASRPTTLAGALAGLKAAQSDLHEFHILDHEPCPGVLFVASIMEGVAALLEREVARG